MAFQLLPSPYNFGNRIWVSSERVSAVDLRWNQEPNDSRWLEDRWANHYPFLNHGPRGFLQRNENRPIYTYCASRYRGYEWITETMVSSTSEHLRQGLRYDYLSINEFVRKEGAAP